MSLPTLFMIGADKGGVGKTMVARAFIDYMVAAGSAPRVFDTQVPSGDLVRFHPASRLVDLATTAGQMQVFDALGQVTIVDLSAGILSKTVGILDRVKILDDAKAGRLKVVLMHVLGASIASLNEIVEVRAHLPTGVRVVLVKNHASADQYEGWTDDARLKDALTAAAADIAVVPNLDALAAERVQLAGGSFPDFISDPTQSRMCRGHVTAWLEDVFQAFDRIGLKS